MRLRPNSAFFRLVAVRRSGYTLIEILVATTLTLMLMTAVVQVFGGVGDGIAKARRALEQFDRMRTTVQQLAMDLKGGTVNFDGRPIRPDEGLGYFELIEGGQGSPPVAISGDTGLPDLNVGPQGHVNRAVLMFTTRNAARPFLGRYAYSVDPTNPTLQSDVAEVAWFLRGTTLHRRVLLVAPGTAAAIAGASKASFYANNDISVHCAYGQIVPNSLGDLTKRENRFGHPASAFPFDARAWGCLGLPTLAECSSPSWMGSWTNGSTPPPKGVPSPPQVDMWDSSGKSSLSVATLLPDQVMASDGMRVADDIVLTNVLSFDVKVWEPAANGGAGGYVDLGYAGTPFNPANVPPQGPGTPRFDHLGAPKSGLMATAQNPARVFDTYNFGYENEGIYYFGDSGRPIPVSVNNYPPGLGKWPAGTSTNGLDDDGNGIVDDANELITQPPYPVPLRGIQITIRCFEPDSRAIREVAIKHDFLPK
jgi:type II secretory pathway pseudopilin PulG